MRMGGVSLCFLRPDVFFFFSVAAPVQSKSALIASVSGPSETQSSPAAICSVRGGAVGGAELKALESAMGQ